MTGNPDPEAKRLRKLTDGDLADEVGGFAEGVSSHRKCEAAAYHPPAFNKFEPGEFVVGGGRTRA